jgi:RNA polymerase sigma-70 factor (ECF subfamily)
MNASTARCAPVEWGAIHRLCLVETRRILGADARADDAAQEATIRAWRHWDRRVHSRAVTGWVRTIARHEAYRIARERRGEICIDELELPSGGDTSDMHIDAVDVRSALRSIDVEDRHLLIARYWEELPHAETARRLGLSEAAVRVRLHRIHTRLRSFLREPM